MNEHIYPNELRYQEEQRTGERFEPLELISDLKLRAKDAGLWNLFLESESGLSNLEYAPLAEEMGRVLWCSEVFNCSAPDSGNMEVLDLYGSEQQKITWLQPLLNGDIRSCFAMTEPDVASSDATNIAASIEKKGDRGFIINGTKWWVTGGADKRTKFAIVMGKTNPSANRYNQQSMLIVPIQTEGVRIERILDVFGYDDAPNGHAEISFKNVFVPAENIILGEGRGFEIAQGRLGPGRVHHMMRLIGGAERALELLVARAKERIAFGKTLAEQGVIQNWIAESRIQIEQSRLLVLKTAWKMDKVGNKNARLEIAMIKAIVPQTVQQILDRAIQVFGGAGVSSDSPLAFLWTAARILRIADGPDEVHLASIAKMELRKNGN